MFYQINHIKCIQTWKNFPALRAGCNSCSAQWFTVLHSNEPQNFLPGGTVFCIVTSMKNKISFKYLVSWKLLSHDKSIVDVHFVISLQSIIFSKVIFTYFLVSCNVIIFGFFQSPPPSAIKCHKKIFFFLTPLPPRFMT